MPWQAMSIHGMAVTCCAFIHAPHMGSPVHPKCAAGLRSRHHDNAARMLCLHCCSTGCRAPAWNDLGSWPACLSSEMVFMKDSSLTALVMVSGSQLIHFQSPVSQAVPKYESMQVQRSLVEWL